MLEEIMQLEKGGSYAIFPAGQLSDAEVDQLVCRFKAAEATPVLLDPGMTIHPLDRDEVYAFRINHTELKPYQVGLFGKSLEHLGVKAVFIDQHVQLGELTFADYERYTTKTALYPDLGENFVYPTLGAVGEGGELLEKVLRLEIHLSRLSEGVKKLWRDYGITSQKVFDGTAAMLDEPTFQKLVAIRDGIIKELGDVQWYVAATARELHVSLAEVAKINIEKLAGRLERGTVSGSGDHR